MGAKQSTGSAPRVRTYSNAGQATSMASSTGGYSVGGPSTSSGVMGARTRARSLGNVQNGSDSHGLSIPNNNGGVLGTGSPDSDSSTPEDGPFARAFMHAHSLPVHLLSLHDIKCPVCTKYVPPDDIECHLVMCLTKPRISYNEDVLAEDKGECIICFEELVQGDTIARLPCLCVYHKSCIDSWFQVNRSCPEHPAD